MAIIKTKKGKEILIDDEDLELVSKFTWYIHSRGYACSHIHQEKLKVVRKQIKLHRLITNCPADKIVDHC
jgi:hypothetical protein